jgi:hypothetical protein
MCRKAEPAGTTDKAFRNSIHRARLHHNLPKDKEIRASKKKLPN